MADGTGQADIRGINVDKLAKGFADQEFKFKTYLTVSPTSARELRWYQKTAGVLNSTSTQGITASQIYNMPHGALPTVVRQSWTRNTSYVKGFKVESDLISVEDIRDSDPDVLATTIRDLTRSVLNQVDYRILDVMSGTVQLSGTAAGAGWDDASAGNPVQDIVSGAAEIATNGYEINNLVAWVHPRDYKNLFIYLYAKGAQSTQFVSNNITDASINKVAGARIVISPNATQGQVMLMIPERAATWKEFMPINAVTIDEPMIGVKIRVGEEGEVLFTDPKAAYLIKAVN